MSLGYSNVMFRDGRMFREPTMRTRVEVYNAQMEARTYTVIFWWDEWRHNPQFSVALEVSIPYRNIASSKMRFAEKVVTALGLDDFLEVVDIRANQTMTERRGWVQIYCSAKAHEPYPVLGEVEGEELSIDDLARHFSGTYYGFTSKRMKEITEAANARRQQKEA